MIRAIARYINSQPLKRQLTAIAMVSSLAALVTAMLIFIGLDMLELYKGLEREARINATVAAAQSEAALLFNDKKTAGDILRAFGAEEHIRRLRIFDRDKNLFASHEPTSGGDEKHGGAPGVQQMEPVWGEDSLTILAPVVLNGETIGWVEIESDLSMAQTRYRWYGFIAVIILLIWAPAALLLSVNLQRIISKPLLDLASVAGSVSRGGDYSQRAEGEYSHEIGDLFSAFNGMLNQIQARDKRLANHASELEARVAERTLELQSAKERAENATALKDRFVSLVSHDLRAPLCSITGILDLINEDLGGPERSTSRKNLIPRALASSRRLTAMIDNLLNIGRLKTGSLRLYKTRFKAASIADNAIAGIESLAEGKKVTLINNLPKELTLFADEGLFAETLANLLSNAVKFCNAGDTVTIYQPEGQPCSVAVKDTGVGIRPEMIGDIFDHNIKTSLPGTSGEMGMGLGLPYCHEIIAAHGGSIKVESSLGIGSVFLINLPETRIVILLADPRESWRLVMKESLKKLNFAGFIEAESPAEALDAIRDNRPDLVISCLDNAGFVEIAQMLAQSRKQDATSAQVILVGSCSEGELETKRRKAIDEGADDFTPYPPNPEDFVLRVSRLLALASAGE